MKKVYLTELIRYGLNIHWVKCDDCKGVPREMEKPYKTDICGELERELALEKLRQ